jgi:hypothetical protein
LLLHLSVVLFSIFLSIYQSNLTLIWNFDAYVIRFKGFSIQKFVSRAVGTFFTYSCLLNWFFRKDSSSQF